LGAFRKNANAYEAWYALFVALEKAGNSRLAFQIGGKQVMNTTIQLPPLPAPPKRNTAGGSIQEIESGLLAYFQRWLDRDDLQFECRFLFVGSNKPQGAFFDLTVGGIANAAALVHSMDQRSDCRGCYATINPAKRNDKPRNKLLNQLTKDADILEEKCFHVLVDVDPAKSEGFTDFPACH
jgi:hypothetical protein